MRLIARRAGHAQLNVRVSAHGMGTGHLKQNGVFRDQVRIGVDDPLQVNGRQPAILRLTPDTSLPLVTNRYSYFGLRPWRKIMTPRVRCVATQL